MPAPGGPFNEQARGRMLPPDLSMPDPANQVAVEEAISTAANAGLGQTAGDQQRSAARAQLSITPPNYGDYRVTNQDFYPSDGVQVSRSTQVGQYGGSPIYTASAPKATMSLFAARGQALYKEQQELDAAKAKLFSGDGLDKAPAPYQQGMDKMWDQSFNTLLAEGIAYTGNENRAVKEMMTEGTLLNRRFKQLSRDYNTIVGERKYAFDKAVAYNTAVRERTWIGDEKTNELAKKVEQGYLGVTPDNVQTLAHIVPEFDNRLSVYEYINKHKVTDQIKEAYAQIDKLPERIQMKGGGLAMIQRTLKTAEAAVGSLKKELKAYYPDDVMKDSDIDEIVDSLFPPDKLIEARQYATYQGGSSETAQEKAGAWVGEVERGVRSMVGGTDQYGQGLPAPVVDRMPFGSITGDKRVDMAKATFTDRSGKPVDMMPKYIEYDHRDGNLYVAGLSTTDKKRMAEAQELTATTENWDIDAEEREAARRKLEQITTTMTPVRVLLKPNEGKVATVLGGRPWEGVLGGGGQQAAPTKQAPYGNTVVQNGVTYTWNPATGSYE